MRRLNKYGKVLLSLELFATFICLFIVYACTLTTLYGTWFAALWVAFAILALCIIGKDIYGLLNKLQDK